jgi:hypothetical protein
VAPNKAAGNAASKTSTKDIKDTKEAKAPATAK